MPKRIFRLFVLVLVIYLYKRRNKEPPKQTSSYLSTSQIDQEDTESTDFLENRWLHQVLKRGKQPPPRFSCFTRPRDYQTEPILLYSEDKLYKQNYTASDAYSMQHCPTKWKWTSEPWKADAVLIEMVSYGNQLPIKPKKYCPQQKLVLRSMESAWNYPALDIAKSELGYDLISDYRLDSDVPLSYVTAGSWLDSPPPKPGQFVATNSAPYPLASAFISNCQSHLERNKIIKKLVALLGKDKIHFYGKCWNNAKLTSHLLKLSKEKQKTETMGRYKFSLVFENSISRDYVTEKLYHAFSSNTLPIYYGDTEIRNNGLLPNKTSIIHVMDYTVEELAQLLHTLDKDWKAYSKYFEWKKWPKDPKWIKMLEQKRRRIHDTCHLATLLSIAD